MTALNIMEKGLNLKLCAADRNPGSKRLHPSTTQCFVENLQFPVFFSKLNQGVLYLLGGKLAYSFLSFLLLSFIVDGSLVLNEVKA